MGLAYASPGIILPRSNYNSDTTYPEPIWASMRHAEKTLTSNQLSMYMPIDQALGFSFMIKYVTAPTTTTTIQIASDPTFADAQTLDTIAASGATVNFWTSSQLVHYQGCVRVKNTSDAVIAEVRGQVISNTTGGVLV